MKNSYGIVVISTLFRLLCTHLHVYTIDIQGWIFVGEGGISLQPPSLKKEKKVVNHSIKFSVSPKVDFSP